METELTTDNATEVANTNNGSDKFKDENALKKAYDSLQAEFTKRCQRIKELEGEIKNLNEKSSAVDNNDLKDGHGKDTFSSDQKLRIINEFLDEVKKTGEVPSVLSAVGAVKTPPSKPKTVGDATKLVKDLFLKN
ncbi:MAG: hypothetical protein J6V68_03690 [Clostridia bacterium]|nr:hypothetical protein [Clostridia bacterium]